MSHYDQNKAHFEVFGAATRDHTLLILPRELKWDTTSRSKRRKSILTALGRFIDLDGVTKIYDDETDRLDTETKKRLHEHGLVTIYELVKTKIFGRRMKNDVVVYEYGKPFADIGNMIDIQYNLASQGFRMKAKSIETEGDQDERVKRIRIEVCRLLSFFRADDYLLLKTVRS